MPVTFLPNIRFFTSIRTLDDARVGRQRQDALKILRGLMGEEQYHISQDMWSGYEYTLGVYGMTACSVWQQERGKEDDIALQIHDILKDLPHEFVVPPWMEDLDVHRSHRSYLIRKDPHHYASQWPNTPENMPLLWPQIVDTDPRGYRLRLSDVEEKLLLSGERELPEWLEYDENKREVIELEEEE